MLFLVERVGVVFLLFLGVFCVGFGCVYTRACACVCVCVLGKISSVFMCTLLHMICFCSADFRFVPPPPPPEIYDIDTQSSDDRTFFDVKTQKPQVVLHYYVTVT